MSKGESTSFRLGATSTRRDGSRTRSRTRALRSGEGVVLSPRGAILVRGTKRPRPSAPDRTRREGGAAAVEAALVLCFIVIPLVFGAVSYAYMLSFRQSVSQAATEAARAAAVKAVSGTPAQRQAAQTDAAKAAVAQALGSINSSMSCGTGNLVCDVAFVTCPDVSPAGCVKVQVSYPYRDHSLLPTVPGLGFTLPSQLGYTAVAGVS
jgi:Flp pilus assembly protein TadG